MVGSRDAVRTTEKLPIALIKNELFADLLGNVYHYAIDALENNFAVAKHQLKKQREDPTYKVSACKHMYSQEWGWPCYHDCMKVLEAKDYGKNVWVSLDKFDKHWLVDRNAKGGTHERRVKEPAKVRKARLKEKGSNKGSKKGSTERRGLTVPELRELQPVSMDAQAYQSTTHSPAEPTLGRSTPIHRNQTVQHAATTPVTSSAPAHIPVQPPHTSTQPYRQLAPAAPYTQRQVQTHYNNASVIHNYYTVVEQLPLNLPLPVNGPMGPPAMPSQYNPPPSNQQFQYNQQHNRPLSQSQQPPHAYAAPPWVEPVYSQGQSYSQQQPGAFIDATYGNAGVYQPASAPHRPWQWAHRSYTRE